MAVDLSQGASTGAESSDRLFDIENAIGSVVADSIRGGYGPNVLDSGAGDDVLFGDSGADGYAWDADTLTGGAGKDRFANDWWQQSTPDACDTITDFEGVGSAPGDRIDLAGVYAGTLTFRGTNAFTSTGQVRVAGSGYDTLVQVNLTGSTAPGMAILIQDGTATASQWTVGDFIL